jgi:hypothetical protein
MDRERKTWTTEDEIDFIINLKGKGEKSRLDVLRMYRKSLEARQLFKKMDQDSIMACIIEEILKEEGKVKK